MESFAALRPENTVKIVDQLLRIYSLGFIAVLCLFFLGIGLLAKLSGSSVDFPMLPWSGAELVNWIIGLSLLGLISMGLAAAGKLKWLFALFTVYVFCQMVYGFYIGPHRFEGYDDFRGSMNTSLSGFVAMTGALRNALKRQ